MYLSIFRPVIIGSLLAVVYSSSQALEYGSGIANTEWKLSGSIFECRFEQVLPEYGNGVFYHQAGEDILFRLETLSLIHI